MATNCMTDCTAVAFSTPVALQLARRREAVEVGSWPELLGRGCTPCDDRCKRTQAADRTIIATVSPMRRVGGLVRALQRRGSEPC